ncbi:transposase [bacterium AH-315-I18]|nr:transposase [bacterium AH-315-I18]
MTDDFKRDAVGLVIHENDSFKAAARAVGVCEKSLRDWHQKFAPVPEPCGENATNQQPIYLIETFMPRSPIRNGSQI